MENKKINVLKYKKMKELLHPLLIKVMNCKTTGELVLNGELPNDCCFYFPVLNNIL